MSIKKAFDSMRLGSAVNARGLGGETFLTRAVKMGLPAAAKEFIELGADPDRANAAGERPLYIALDLKDRAMIATLLQAGADARQERNGLSFRDNAIRAGMPEIARLADAVENERMAMAVALSCGRCF
jgi:ankyrin repeat protein